MSFPRAPLKRFNDHVGCAPPPGTYDLKNGEVKGAASFHKSERFKSIKATGQPSPVKDLFMSPMRRTMSVDGLTDRSSHKKEKATYSVHQKQQKLLEKEIRSLMHQRKEQDRRLRGVEEEMRKMEGKLQSAMREKTGLAASVASLERQLGELTKTNDFLKTKFSADSTKKKINSLSLELIETKNKLDAKDKELSYLQIASEGQVKVLETDLEASQATLNALKERNRDLEELHQETKVHNEELENEMDKLQAVIQELREEVRVLQGYLDNANEEIQCLRMKMQQKVSETDQDVSDSRTKMGELEEQLEQRTQELRESQEALGVKEQKVEKHGRDLEDSQTALRETREQLEQCSQQLRESREALGVREQEVEKHGRDLEDSQSALRETREQLKQCSQQLRDSQGAVGQQEQELARLREVLRRTEDELDQRVALLGERCLVLEQERGRTQEEGLRRVEELKAEIGLLQETRKSDKETHQQLQQAHTSLAELLEEEKVRSSSLAALVERLQSETEAERHQLEAELEEALEELSLLEVQDRCSEEAIQRLERENQELEGELNIFRTKVDGKSMEIHNLEEHHLLAMRNLQEEHNSSLRKIGDMATELESTKKALGKEIRHLNIRCQDLEEELSKVTKRFEDEHQQLSDTQKSQEKAKEEYARMLLDAQTRLAQRDAEWRRAAEEHAAEVDGLQRQVEQGREENRELQATLDRESLKRESLETCTVEKERLQLQVEQMVQEKLHLQRLLEEQRRHVAEQEKSTSSVGEMEVWRGRYEELYAKVKPFQEQLDGFAAERSALLNENGATQEELNRLSDAYARLLGHQNQRQKIKHVVKLKEENYSLKQEVTKLRAQVTRQRKDLDQLRAGQGPRRFDPSKAFKLDSKENQPPSSTLREGKQNVH